MRPGRYRKRPVEVEAVRLATDTAQPWEQWTEVSQWVKAHGGEFIVGFKPNRGDEPIPWLRVVTLEGEMQAEPGDWIIRGVKGEFYPCKPDIFEATYVRTH